MKTITVLYSLLGIPSKLPNEELRYLYLKDVWGLDQSTIGDCENMSQSYVSKVLIHARKTIPHQEVVNATQIEFTADEIKNLQFLPREIILDVQLVAFVNDILGIDVNHPLYTHFDHHIGIRIAALASLGVQHKHLAPIYKRSQSATSMAVKRNMDKMLVTERSNRYDKTYTFGMTLRRKHVNNFLRAGGQQ